MSSLGESKGKRARRDKGVKPWLRSELKYEGVTRREAQAIEALRESEEKLRFIFEAIGDGVTILDMQGNIVEVNEAAVRMGGHTSKEQLIGRNGLEFIKKEDRDSAANSVMEALSKGRASGMVEYRSVAADGSERDVQVSVAPIKDKEGNPVGIITVTRDISERKRSEEAVKGTADKLNTILQSVGDAITVVDLKGTIVEVNEAAARLSGYSNKEELVGKSGLELVSPRDRDLAIEVVSQALKGGHSTNVIEYNLRTADGGEKEVEVSFAPFCDNSGETVGIITAARDISERRRAEEALRASEDKLRAMFESIEDAVIVSDMQGTIVEVNDAALRIAGWTREQWVGRNALDIIAEKDRTAAIDSLMKQAQGGVTLESTEITLVLDEGRELDAEFTSSLLRDAAGNPIGTVTVARDITERKKAEEAVRASEEKLSAIFNSAIDGILLIDLMGNFQEVNDATLSMTGYSREDLIGKSALDFVFEEDRQKVVNELASTIESKELVSVPPLLRLLRKDGSLLYAELGSGMIMDKQGNITGLVGVMRNVTERKRLEDEVRASEQKLRAMFEAMSDSVVLSSPDGYVIDLNDAAVRLHGYSNKEEFIGKNALELVAESDRQRVAEQGIKAFKKAGTFDRLEYRVLKADGTEFDAEFSGVPLRDDTGKMVAWVTVSRDITERKRMEEEIRASEEKLRAMFNSAKDGIVVADTLGNIQEINNATLSMIGYSREELIGKSALDFIAEEDKQKVANDIASTLSSKEAIAEALVLSAVRKDGSVFDVEMNTSIMLDKDGSISGFVAVMRDVTERKRLEEEIRKSEEKLRLTFEHMGDGVTVTDLEGKIIEVNDAQLRMSGYSREEFIGRDGWEIISYIDRDRVINDVLKSLKGEEIGRELKYRFLKADGSEYEGELNVSVLRDSAGKPTGFITTVHDITERKRWEDALRTSEEKLRITFESITDAIVVTDTLGTIVQANEGASRLTGYSREELIGKSGLDLIASDYRNMAVQTMGKVFEEGHGMASLELQFLKADGSYVDAEFGTAMLRDASGNAVGFVSIARDITERKQMQEELRKTAEKLRIVVESIGDMLIITDKDLKYVDVNEAAMRLLGCTDKDKLIGKEITEAISAKDRDRVVKELRRALKKKSGIELLEYALVSTDGREHEVESAAEILRDCAGVVVGLVISGRDVSERKRMQEELRASEERLRITFDAIGDGITVTDVNGTITNVNHAVVDMGGFKNKEELIGRNGFELMSEKDRKRIIKETMKAFSEGKSTKRMEYTFVPVVGRPFEAELLLTMLQDSAGKPMGFIALSHDISERKRMEREMKESESRFRQLFENMSSGVAVYEAVDNGEDFVFKDFNRSAEKIGNITKDEIIGRRILEVYPGLKEFGLFAVLQRVWRTGDAEHLPDSYYEDERRRGWRDNYVYKLPTGEVVAVYDDVTDRIMAMEAVRSSEAKLRTMFESTSDGIIVTDNMLNIIDANEAAARIFGHKGKESLIGTSAMGMFSADKVVDADGKDINVEFSLSQLRDNDDNLTGNIGIVRDVTERIRAAAEVLASEEKLRAMFESTSDGIVVTDMTFNIIDANEAAARIFGHKSKESLIGTSALGMVSADKVVDADGKQINIEFSLSQLRDSAGNLTGNIGIVRDVTVRRRMEANLKKMVTNLERSNRDMQQFVYVASHDLQEPLRMISSFTQLLSRRFKGKLDAEADDFITYAVNGANVLQERIQALATFSRVSTQGKPFAPTDIGLVLDRALDNLNAEIQSSKAVVTRDPMPNIIADAAQMTQIFQYLIDNSIKFHGEATPQIHVSAKEQDSEWLFSVSDNGMGIMPEFKERIFVLFQRLHGVEFGGTGIGLPVCKKIVERHGGRIWVESEPGKGSTFYFAIPKEVPEEEVMGETAGAAGA